MNWASLRGPARKVAVSQARNSSLLLIHLSQSNEKREQFQHLEKMSVWRESLPGAMTLSGGLQPTPRNLAQIQPGDRRQLSRSPFVFDHLIVPPIAQTVKNQRSRQLIEGHIPCERSSTEKDIECFWKSKCKILKLSHIRVWVVLERNVLVHSSAGILVATLILAGYGKYHKKKYSATCLLFLKCLPLLTS